MPGATMWRRYAAESAREASDTTLAHGVSRGFHIADATSPVRATDQRERDLLISKWTKVVAFTR